MWKQINRILTLPVLTFITLTMILMWSTTIKSAIINTTTPKEKLEWTELQETLTVSRLLKERDSYNTQMKCLETWERTKDYENYRVATSTDFKFPSGIFNQPYSIDIGKFIKAPYISDEFPDDVYAPELTIVVVDTTITTKAKFGIVIFSKHSGKTEMYWLFKGKDLSSIQLSKNSGGACLTRYYKNGTNISYQISWDKKKKQYYCMSFGQSHKRKKRK